MSQSKQSVLRAGVSPTGGDSGLIGGGSKKQKLQRRQLTVIKDATVIWSTTT